LRILYAHCFYRMSGGEDRHVRDQVKLVSSEHDVDVVSEANVELSEGLITAARMLYSRRKTLHVGAVMDRFGPDVVHIHNMYPALGPAVVMAASRRDIPIVMTIHNYRLRCPNGFLFTEGSMCRRCESGVYPNAVIHRCFPTRKQAAAYAVALWFHRFIMPLEERISRFIVPSEFMRQRLLEWGLGADRVRLVRHFVEGATPPPDAKRGSYGAFVGRLSGEKGLHLFFRALRRAGDPPFVVVGDGPLRSSLEGLVRDLGLANTTLWGWRSAEEVAAVIAGARYVAVPSVWEETASLAALEALAAGRPLLVSDRGALPELVATGAGLMCRPEDEVGTSERVTRLMHDAAFSRLASAEAIRMARALLTPRRHLDGLTAVYEEVA
jgi:glycosyltransferase involved in cell wall biosynthesis